MIILLLSRVVHIISKDIQVPVDAMLHHKAVNIVATSNERHVRV